MIKHRAEAFGGLSAKGSWMERQRERGRRDGGVHNVRQEGMFGYG